MTAYDDIRNLAKGDVWLAKLQAFAAKIESDIGTIAGGALTDALVYGANVETASDDVALAAGGSVFNLVKITVAAKAVALPDATAHVEGRPLVVANPAARNEVQTLGFTGGPTGGTFKLTFSAQETAAITYSATPATTAGNVQTALNALSNLSGIAVTAVSATEFDIEFAGGDGSTDQPLITLSDNSLTGGTTPNAAIAGRRDGIAAGETYAVHDADGRVVLAALPPGQFAVFRSAADDAAHGDWYVETAISVAMQPVVAAATVAAAAELMGLGVTDIPTFGRVLTGTAPGAGDVANGGWSSDGTTGLRLAWSYTGLAHGLTAGARVGAETDTFLTMSPFTDGGGLLQTVIARSDTVNPAYSVRVSGKMLTDTPATNAVGVMQWGAGTHAGAGPATTPAANAILFSWHKYKAPADGDIETLMVLDEDGDLFLNGAAGSAFDVMDDAAVLRSVDLERAKIAGEGRVVLNPSRFDANRYSKEDLADIRLLPVPVGDALPLVNETGLNRVARGAIWQQREMFDALIHVMEARDPGFADALREAFVDRGLPTQILDWKGALPSKEGGR